MLNNVGKLNLIFYIIMIIDITVTSFIKRSHVLVGREESFRTIRSCQDERKGLLKLLKRSEYTSKWLDFHVLPECVDKTGRLLRHVVIISDVTICYLMRIS